MLRAKRPKHAESKSTTADQVREETPQHPQCAQCLPAKCCKYFSLQIDTPRSKRDYDDLLWMLAHRHVSVYVDDKVWYLMVHTSCSFLDAATNMCKIYETRPQMCREHSVDDCEWHGPYDFEEHFRSYAELADWMKKKRMKV
jgi:Fe-S-cluster containining protein